MKINNDYDLLDSVTKAETTEQTQTSDNTAQTQTTTVSTTDSSENNLVEAAVYSSESIKLQIFQLELIELQNKLEDLKRQKEDLEEQLSSEENEKGKSSLRSKISSLKIKINGLSSKINIKQIQIISMQSIATNSLTSVSSGTINASYNSDTSAFTGEFGDMLKQVLFYEGGYANHPNDSGGETNMGITHTTYDTYRQRKGLPTQSVKNITMEEVQEIYYEDFYVASGAAEIAKTDKALAFAVFDAAVNHGVGGAKKLLEQSGYDVDKFMEARKQKYINIVINNPSQQCFALGWQNRWNNVYKYIDPSHPYEDYTGLKG